MTLPEFSINRHVFIYMLTLGIFLFGIIGYKRISIDRFPNVEFPIISISTFLPGAHPEIVDKSITQIIESAVNSVTGIEHIQSTSGTGVSITAITFSLDKNVDAAFNEVQVKVNQILRDLPKEADTPIVAKVEIGAMPILWLALSGDRTIQQLNDYAHNVIKKTLETIDGVGQVTIGGGRERNVRIQIRLNDLATYKLDVKDVIGAIQREHFQSPGGFLVSEGKIEYLIKLDLEFNNLQEFGKIIITYKDNSPIYLHDIANIIDGLEDERKFASFNGKEAIGIGVIKVPTANTVNVINKIKEELHAHIMPNLPEGIRITLASDDSLFIKEMVSSLTEHLILGSLLAGLVVFIFLQSFRSTLIISTAIPISLFGAIIIMYFTGQTLNFMTLLALLLLVGIVVDDAIVVLESIHRAHKNNNFSKIKAAIEGSREVFFSVLASTISIVCIFGPVIFLEGIIGKFFKSFALVITCGVLVSWIISVTLTPVLCSKLLKTSKTYRITKPLESLFNGFESFYRFMLNQTLKRRWTMILALILVTISSSYFFNSIGKEFVPEEDESRFIIIFKTPLGSNISYVKNRLAEIEKALKKQKYISHFFSTIGQNQTNQVSEGASFVTLYPKDQRNISQKQIMNSIQQSLNEIPGIQGFAIRESIVSGQRGDPLQFALLSSDYKKLSNSSSKLLNELNKFPELGKIDLAGFGHLPQILPIIDRVAAAKLGLSSQEIAQTVYVLMGGYDISKFTFLNDNNRYQIRLKANENELKNKDIIKNIYLKSPNGSMVRLDSIVSFQESYGPSVITRLDSMYSELFYSTPTIPLGEAINIIKERASHLLPPSQSIKFLGQAEEFNKTSKYMSFTFLLALTLLYMVLASQFNSLIQPLYIMFSQPLAMIGSIFALWVANQTLNIYSMIGVVLLVGLVAKNAILLIDLTNQKRKEGLNIHDALLFACPIRLRPILMTSFTIILALLPAAMGYGAGSNTNGPLAIAVIGGMLSSTLLTLFIIPTIYSLIGQVSESSFLKKIFIRN